MNELTTDDIKQLLDFPGDMYQYAEDNEYYERLIAAKLVERVSASALKITPKGFHLKGMIMHLCNFIAQGGT